MPLLKIHVGHHWPVADVQTLLDAAHTAVVDAFEVPQRDRYQVVFRHGPDEWVALDTGLSIARSSNLVIIHVISRRRTNAQKEKLYELLAERIQQQCDVEPADLIITVTENEDADWSFGYGRAQFLTGELQ